MKKQMAAAALLALCLAGYSAGGEAAQFFAQKYGFSAAGTLQPALAVKFDKDTARPITGSLVAQDGGRRVMTLAYLDGGNIKLCTFQRGVNYLMYKLHFREGKEDLLVLSYGSKGAGRTMLEDVSVIGSDAMGYVRLLPIAGFNPVEVFNSPLQIRGNEAVLFLDSAAKVMRIAWDEQGGQYVVK
ncbi:MAG: hypothetical protein LKE33_03210 [Acidaminococcus sp.]|jgi:hypothetical protein|nr:hypothetical protein [Acidaminococcus sp.]